VPPAAQRKAVGRTRTTVSEVSLPSRLGGGVAVPSRRCFAVATPSRRAYSSQSYEPMRAATPSPEDVQARTRRIAATVVGVVQSTLVSELKYADAPVKQVVTDVALFESLLFALYRWLIVSHRRITLAERTHACETMIGQLAVRFGVGLNSLLGSERWKPRETELKALLEILESRRTDYSQLCSSPFRRIVCIFGTARCLDRAFLEVLIRAQLRRRDVIVPDYTLSRAVAAVVDAVHRSS